MEIIIVIGIFAVLAVFTAPTIIKFFQWQNVDDVAASVESTLRQARSQAMYQKNDASHGVKLLSGSYVLFQGNSYASRTISYDLTTAVPTGITFSGITEVTFTKRTGLPSTTGTVTIQSPTKTKTITINSQGLIQ